jgi:hypothetical protein
MAGRWSELLMISCTRYKTSKLNFVALVSERTIPTERPQPVGKLLRIEGCSVVSAMDPLRP